MKILGKQEKIVLLNLHKGEKELEVKLWMIYQYLQLAMLFNNLSKKSFKYLVKILNKIKLIKNKQVQEDKKLFNLNNHLRS